MSASRFREHMRVHLPLVVEVKFKGDSDYQPYLLTDISWGGMYFRMDSPPEIGIPLIALIPALDSKETVEIKGRVVTRDKPVEGREVSGVGVEFDDLDHDTKGLIQKLVDRLISSGNQ